MEELIGRFSEQWRCPLTLLNGAALSSYDHAVLVGLGGSALAADLYLTRRPEVPLLVWRDYNLPESPSENWPRTRLILSSYSGQTAEVLMAARSARARGWQPLVLASGGELWRLAEECNWPRIVLPAGWPQRLAVGVMLRALAQALGDEATESDLQSLPASIFTAADRERSSDLARRLRGTVPVVYAANARRALAYFWKISLNETGKMPAFYNVLPEANHNELEGFAAQTMTPFSFIFITAGDNESAPIARRFQILDRQIKSKGWSVEWVEAGHDWQALFRVVLLATATATAHARLLGLDPLAVPTIDKFKEELCQT